MSFGSVNARQTSVTGALMITDARATKALMLFPAFPQSTVGSAIVGELVAANGSAKSNCIVWAGALAWRSSVFICESRRNLRSVDARRCERVIRGEPDEPYSHQRSTKGNLICIFGETALTLTGADSWLVLPTRPG